jgi:predicted transglutaminase-like cysteine proteinase
MVNTLGFPLKRMPNVVLKDLWVGMRKMGYVESIIYYIINSSTRRSVQLSRWISNHYMDVPLPDMFKGQEPSDALALAISKYVRLNIRYVGDKTVWSADEYWETPTECWDKKEGDCEDGAILTYSWMKQAGFSDDQVFLVAGDVKGGGHCYVDYISFDDGCDYTLDWCYWPTGTLKVKYGLNNNYFCGTKEWFRFNASGSYVTQ